MRSVFRQLIEKQAVNPYISGHITDGSSTFTFTVNDNESVTVPVDANGDWKWVVDRTITNFQDSFKQKNNIEKLFIYDKLNDCTSLYGMFTDASALQEVEFRNAIFNKVTTTAYMLNRAYALTKLKLPNAQFDSLTTVSNMFIDATNLETIEIKSFKISLNLRWQSKLTEQSVINLINAAQASITITLHSTVYNKCASGGEWYTDIQAAIDAKALEGYTVTLISA